MTKLDGRTPDLAAEHIEQLKAIFPDVFEEGKVDFDKLRQDLGEYVDDEKERYNFSWNGKGRALRLSQTPSAGTLRPCEAESKNWDDTQNLYIEGDNLEVLKLLQKSYHDKVKIIYIDPPYNTGNDFVYPDNFADSIENYKKLTGQVDDTGKRISTNSEANGRFHTDWLNMMYPRLRLARNLLTEDGVIFISIDDNEQGNLKKICDEVFGEENFVGQIVLRTATDNNPRQISTEHEYILVYAKRLDMQNPWQAENENSKLIIEKYQQLKSIYHDDTEKIQAELRSWIKANSERLDGVSHYDNVDDHGVFHDGDIANTVFGGYKYEIIHPVTGRPCKIPDKGYRFSKDTMQEMISHGDIMFGPDETTLIKPKKRIENAKDILRTVIYEDGRASTKRFEAIMARDIFQNPKSDTIIERLINFVTDADDIILDFFSGSATTAQSVMQLNSKDGKRRKYIMVQLPEDLDENIITAAPKAKKTLLNAIDFLTSIKKPHILTEIGKERIRRAGEKIKAEVEEQNAQMKFGEEPKKAPDIGFKVFKLDSSNLRKWQPDYEHLELSLEDIVKNYVDGRTELDVVYEIMIKMGLPLTCPLEKHTVSCKNIYVIGMGALMICLDNNITTEVADGMAALYKELAPETWKVVFKDNGFATDSAKVNAKEILKCAGLDEDAFTTV